MNIEQLKALRAIADLGTFEKAAESLCLTQPALSAQIKLLEAEAGEPLFIKTGRRKALSPSGQLVLSHARVILAEMDRIKDELDAARGLSSGSLSIAAGDLVACRLLAFPLSVFAAEHPGIRLHLWSRTSDESASLVREGGADIGIATLPIDGTGLAVEAWREYGWIAVRSRRRSDETHGGEIEEADLDRTIGDTLLLLEKGTRARRAADSAFEAAGKRPERVLELGGVDAQIRLASAGLGTAIVPDFAFVAREGPEAESFPLPWMPKRELGLVHRAESLSSAAAAFLALLKKTQGA
jgi:DNA-binding transcriptional LysR family regulator